MPSFIQKYATPFITGLFLVSLVSGVALFVHVGGAFRGMHEWLSMVLIVPFGLHLWRNWRAMTVYFAKPAFTVAMLASLAAAGAFVAASAGGGGRGDGPPQFAVWRALEGNSAAKIAPLLGATPDALVDALKAAGFTGADLDTPLKDILAKSGRDDFELAGALAKLAKSGG